MTGALPLALVLLSAPLSLAADAWQTKANCDIPAASLQELKAQNLEECQRSCEATKGCLAAVFASGWQKCFLKSDGTKRASMRFISGVLNDQHAYEPGSYKVDSDHKGKDLERLVLDSPDQCGQACAAKSECQAFTFIEGYRVCWLKKKGGQYSAKVFYCAYR
jgi:hypothetical protein